MVIIGLIPCRSLQNMTLKGIIRPWRTTSDPTLNASRILNITKEIEMQLSKPPTEIAALLQAYVAEHDDNSPAANDILSIAAELLIYDDASTSRPVASIAP